MQDIYIYIYVYIYIYILIINSMSLKREPRTTEATRNIKEPKPGLVVLMHLARIVC